MIPYGKQDINQDDIDAVLSVLKSDWLTQGPKVPEFESAISTICGAHYCVALNSATSALHIACLALGVGPGDTVWTSPISFVASANCALYCGADVNFVDVETETGNMSVNDLKNRLAIAKANNTLPKVVIPVHLAGQSCDMQAIHKLGTEYGFAIIEDASHAIGAQYQSQYVGNCQYSDFTVFSFHPVKIVTSAEGGALTTNSATLAEKATLLRSHGITNKAEQLKHESHGPWYYEQHQLGYNYRMTDLQAALGTSQLQRVHDFVSQRNKLAKRYTEKLPDTCSHLLQSGQCYSAYHLYVILLDKQSSNKQRAVIETLRSNHIIGHLHYIPIHLQPYYQDRGFRQGDFPRAEEYYARAVTLPLHPNLTFDEQDQVLSVLSGALA
ncbi:UDP-4-amino-4,6-dideoxy-N-acetyl-beta-L-altrosamine transaminase [Pseudoalteromonas sp. SMS1]|uniref:UDP-4-amino-4, 6-dideoxy-N-acetyl-beta-L-altrosamine transaminase n=1 Tax=Pseudoalteromonas sp. SMS1 TaxID=2908894 RepID=UPI001F3DA55D|nr:UDP-4-amino-4,6-dideoxy-N-acetyl-beta-L-altrosamine transaminase [Pseudoalteromonas sp. SMS1]MCF2859375.1 UDP-4-amino-4,6-dideoxy-N-acetyl-beta-L-altrosamine transaminase [Pseudoalteromonas sp. SMS1]